ncbi:hypothetical protein HON71_02570 [Candidatus Woesearchaeota archaeon]|jgi:hypothetical protein|nr:hypothetical protein [Candidatus Woesearchaeota archaeon]MBT5341948.1 hypothetical protein [Candidatus Woesearchaeota archaeon]
MKKIITGVLSTIIALPAVLAGGAWNKTSACPFYGAKGGSWMISWGLLKLVYLAVAVFIISAVFWWTYKWIVVDKKTVKRKKR